MCSPIWYLFTISLPVLCFRLSPCVLCSQNPSVRLLQASNIDEENFKIINAEGAVQAVLECATRRVDEPAVEAAALGCLCAMARHLPTAFSMVKYGAADVVTTSMAAAPDNAVMVESAMKLLTLLSLIRENDGKDKCVQRCPSLFMLITDMCVFGVV